MIKNWAHRIRRKLAVFLVLTLTIGLFADIPFPIHAFASSREWVDVEVSREELLATASEPDFDEISDAAAREIQKQDNGYRFAYQDEDGSLVWFVYQKETATATASDADVKDDNIRIFLVNQDTDSDTWVRMGYGGKAEESSVILQEIPGGSATPGIASREKTIRLIKRSEKASSSDAWYDSDGNLNVPDLVIEGLWNLFFDIPSKLHDLFFGFDAFAAEAATASDADAENDGHSFSMQGYEFAVLTATVSLAPVSISITLPDFTLFLYGNTYDLLPSTVAAKDENDITYPVRVTSVTRTLSSGEEDTDWEWDGDVSLTVDDSSVSSYTIVYEAYDGNTVLATESLVVSVYADAGIGGCIDSIGDYAYLTAELVDGSLVTGTSPFDTEESAGNDTSSDDTILRTYDVATFNFAVESKVRDSSVYRHYESGTVCFEFVLPYGSDEAIFEEDSMLWLQVKPNISYETVEIDGNTVLRGSFLWEPAEGSSSAIGEGYLELMVAVRALAMKNGDVIQPKVSVWLGVNDIGAGELAFAGSGDEASGYTFPDTLANTGSVCEEHQESEIASFLAPAVTVSAAPMYNVRIVASGSTYTGLGSFDFSTGTDSAPNKGSLVVTDGRVGNIGAMIELKGKTGQGMKGMEMPDESTEITFDLTLTPKVALDGGSAKALSNNYYPLLWSVEGNTSGSTQSDGRTLPSSIGTKAASGVPLNTGSNYRSCQNGGTWSAEQDGLTVHVTVSGFTFDLSNLSGIPYASVSGNAQSYTFYDPTTITDYWDLERAIFSAGELWFVQPFTRIDESGDTIQILSDEEEWGTGANYSEASFTTTFQDSNFHAVSVSGTETTSQMTTNDDSCTLTLAYRLTGTFSSVIMYNEYYGDYNEPLTEGCMYNGLDWATIGTKCDIHAYLCHDGKDGEYRGLAYDNLLKFDNVMFEPDGKNRYNGTNVLYGVLKGRETLGWDHKGEDPDGPDYDQDMIHAGIGDMTFYTWSEYSALKESDGYVCVAVLHEFRGCYGTQMTHNHSSISGTIKVDSSLDGNVYMVQQATHGWRLIDVQDELEAYYGVSINELTDTQISTYAKNIFPSQKQTAYNGNGYEDYPDAGLNWDAESKSGTSGYKKTTYNADGSVSYTLASNYYGDSCLVTGYTVGVSKSAVQTTASSGTVKTVYDMDASQRVADYAIYPVVNRAEGIDGSETQTLFTIPELTITDTLPKGLTYIPYSGYIGGTYEMTGEGRQGTVTGGVQTDPEITSGSDGSTILTWTLTNLTVSAAGTVYLDPIYYSCDIGQAGSEEDVVNNQKLANTVTIGSTDLTQEYSETNGNLAVFSIQISKLLSASISNVAEPSAVEAGDSLLYTSKVGNGSASSKNILAVVSIPYDGDDNGSSFSGGISVTGLYLDALPDGITFYYTTSTDYLGVTSSDLTSSEVTDSVEWEELTFEYNSQTGRWEAVIPDGIDMTAIAAVGSLSANSTLTFQTELSLDDPQPGDYVSFALSEGTMISTARAYVVSRSIEGLAWMDENADGLYSSGEELLEGVTLLLMQDGQAVAETTTNSTGVYTFTDVAAGDYEIWFTGDLVRWMRVTGQNAGADTMDSDAEGLYESDGLTLSYAKITGIALPDISEIQTAKYVSRHNDAGFLIPKGSLVFDKTDSDSGDGLAGSEFTLTGTAFTTDSGDEDGAFALAVEAFIEWVNANQTKAGITLTGSTYTDTTLEIRFVTTGSQINFGYPDVSDILVRRLPRGEYILEETGIPTGYTAQNTQYPFTIDTEGTDIAYTIADGNEVKNDPQTFTIRKLARDTGEAMDGVTFTITGGGTTKTIVTGTDGTAEFTFSGLSLGAVYEVAETDTGSWTAYETAETFWFILEEGSDGVYLVLTDASGQRAEYSRISMEDSVTIQVVDVRRIVELQITKTVDQLFEVPSFLFRIESDDGDVYYTAITLDGTESGTTSISVEAGHTYTVSEVSVSRYALKEITGTENVTVGTDTAQVSFTTEDSAQVFFTNTLANWGKFSHTSMIINEVGR